MRTSVAIAAMMFSALLGNPSGGASAQGVPAPERFVLNGVLVFEGGSGLAYLQEPILTGDRVVVLRPGQSIGPYRLTRILEDRVELEGPGGTVLIPVHGGHGGSGTVVASVAGGAGQPSGPSPTGRVGRAGRGGAAIPDGGSVPLDQIVNPQADAALAKALVDRMETLRKQSEQELKSASGSQRQGDHREGDAQPVAPARPGAGAGNAAAQNPPPAAGSNAIMLRAGDPLRRQTFQSFIGAK